MTVPNDLTAAEADAGLLLETAVLSGPPAINDGKGFLLDHLATQINPHRLRS